MITYPNYKFYFPVKAFGMYKNRWGDEKMPQLLKAKPAPCF